ncbi:hypothetical protein ACFLZW_02890 [Chloroflexota bacterium]
MAVERRISCHTWLMVEGIFTGKDILLVQTGIGKECAQGATNYILEKYPIKVIISLGFGGALAAEVNVGALVVCQKLFNGAYANDNRFCSSDPNLIAQVIKAMNGLSICLISGNALTVDHLVIRPEEKGALGKAFPAQVVDMESFWIASIANRRKIPFLAVRSISDTLGESMPPFDRFLNSKGAWLWKEALHHFLTTPGDLIELPRLFIHAQTASRSLTTFLRVFIPELNTG